MVTAQPLTAVASDLGRLYDLRIGELEALQATAPDDGTLALMLAFRRSEFASPTQAQRLLDELIELPADASVEDEIFHRSVRGRLHLRLGQVDAAEVDCNGATQRLTNVDARPFLRYMAENCQGFLAHLRGQAQKAWVTQLRAEVAAQAANSDRARLRTLSNQTVSLIYLGLYHEAISRFVTLDELLLRVDDPDVRAVVRFNRGLAQLESGEPEKALDAFRQGGRWARETDQPLRALIADTYTARALIDLDRNDEARLLLDTWLERPTQDVGVDALAHAYSVAARAELNLGNTEAASRFVQRGLSLPGIAGNPVRGIQLGLIDARISTVQTAYSDAQDKLIALQVRFSGVPTEYRDDLLIALAETKAALGEFELAYAHAYGATLVGLELRRSAFDQQLALVAERAATDRRRLQLAKEASASREARALDRQRFLVGLLAAGALLVVLTLYWLQRDRRTKGELLGLQKAYSADLESLVEDRTRSLEARMSELMQQRETQLQLERRLAEDDKMRALGQLTGGVAHDFNNLLTVMLASADQLATEAPIAPAQRQKLAAAILQSAETGAEINRALLSFARRQPLQPVPVRLEEHIESRHSLLQRALGPEQKLVMRLEPVVATVDRSMLTTAIINLLTNAREASAADGEIVLSVAVAVTEKRPMALIEVQDSGQGMTDEQLHRSKEPFYSTKSSNIATGLGLSIVDGFVHQSGGTLRIRSRVGQGTTVSLLLPVADRATVDRPEWDDAPGIRGLRVLLLDDNPRVQESIHQMLVTLECEVIRCSTVRQAERLLSEQPVDLLLSDVNLAGDIDGETFALQATATHPSPAVLLITGYADTSVTRFPVLLKPFSSRDLKQALAAVVREAAGLDRLHDKRNLAL
ncbi:MAG: ATP-binding protein [Pseudomonadota bacterium]